MKKTCANKYLGFTDLKIDTVELSPESQRRLKKFALELRNGKDKWEIMTVDELPLHLALNPEQFLKWSLHFTANFITALFYRLSFYIYDIFHNY
ncbi:MAG: hypothetical protein LBR74_04830 [Eubacterium sp.]|nr:hypothetical protein [Eubacterium sp.]